MGNPSYCWFEPEALAAALARAGIGGAPSTSRWGRPPQRTAREAAARDLFAQEPIVSTPLNRERVTYGFVPPPGGLQDRLQAFLAWVIAQSGCRQVFVVDGEGLVLMDHEADELLVAISSSFMSLLARVHTFLESAAPHGSLMVELADGQLLYLLQVETSMGVFAAGFVVAEPVTRALLAGIKLALVRVLDEELEAVAAPEGSARTQPSSTAEGDRT